jgi:hypothetical protein
MTSQNHTPERAFAEAVLEDAVIGEDDIPDDAKALRAARALGSVDS